MIDDTHLRAYSVLTYEDRAFQDYKKANGRLFRCSWVYGYSRNEGIQFDVCGDVIVRVLNTDFEALRHWCDEWLDPYWDVEIVHWISQPQDLRSCWIYGPSYNRLTGEREFNGASPITRMAYLIGRIFGFKEAA